METPEEKSQRNNCVKEEQLRRITDGGVSHDVWVTRSLGLPGMIQPIDPVVEMANNDDGHYRQVFRNRDELRAFVATLLAAADDAWPKGAA